MVREGMANYFWLTLMMSYLVFAPSLDAVDVTASIDGSVAVEGKEVRGTITVTHDKNELIDIRSFKVGSTAITVEKVKDVEISPSSPIILTIYEFRLPPQPVGLQLLPAVSVDVAGKKYRSLASSYEVEKPPSYETPPPSPSAPKQQSEDTTPFLRLEASIDGPSALYPTQRTRLVYRYFFNENIDLTSEKLPLLDAVGLVKIGEKQLRDVQDGTLTAREIAQEVEASLPGKYLFGPSLIEGYAYRADAAGNILSRSSLLRSEAPTVELTVLPFPIEGKPQAFNGAVGDYTFSAELQGSNEVDVGSDLSVVLKIQGKGNIESVPLPDVCCQPGFVGLFRVSDLPPAISVKGDTKTAVILLKPMSPLLTSIPEISFSFFSPASKQYVTRKSIPIPIVVKGALPKQKLKGKRADEVQGREIKEIAEPSHPPLDLIEAPLSQKDLHNKPFGSWWALWIIPFGIAFVGYQLYLRAFLQNRSALVGNSSDTLLRIAKKEEKSSSSYFAGIIEALKTRLSEANLISSPSLAMSQWPPEGVCHEVSLWLGRLEETRFSGKPPISTDELERDVESFFAKIPIAPLSTTSDLLRACAPLVLFGTIILGALLWSSGLWSVLEKTGERTLSEAQELVQSALKDTMPYGRETSLLRAREMYHTLEEEFRPSYGSGRLDMAIGNVYGHLGDIPTAIWHYNKAEALMPRDEAVRKNRQELEKLLFLEEKQRAAAPLSLPEWMQTFFFFAVCAIAVVSAAVWTQQPWMLRFARMAVVCAVIALIPLAYYKYFSPLYGTVITSTNLRAGPASTFPVIGQTPTPSGSRLEVVGMADEGRWIQVYTPEGTNGYVLSENLRL